MTAKQACLMIGNQPTDIIIKPGTTAADILRDSGQSDTDVLSLSDGLAFAPGEDVFGTIPEGAKLFVSSKPTVASPQTIRRGSILEDRKWKPVDLESYQGYYRTKNGAWEGRIENASSPHPDFFIKDPPLEVLVGEHGACFHKRTNGYYWVHFSPPKPNLYSGVITIEIFLKNETA